MNSCSTFKPSSVKSYTHRPFIQKIMLRSFLGLMFLATAARADPPAKGTCMFGDCGAIDIKKGCRHHKRVELKITIQVIGSCGPGGCGKSNIPDCGCIQWKIEAQTWTLSPINEKWKKDSNFGEFTWSGNMSPAQPRAYHIWQHVEEIAFEVESYRLYSGPLPCLVSPFTLMNTGRSRAGWCHEGKHNLSDLASLKACKRRCCWRSDHNVRFIIDNHAQSGPGKTDAARGGRGNTGGGERTIRKNHLRAAIPVDHNAGEAQKQMELDIWRDELRKRDTQGGGTTDGDHETAENDVSPLYQKYETLDECCE